MVFFILTHLYKPRVPIHHSQNDLTPLRCRGESISRIGAILSWSGLSLLLSNRYPKYRTSEHQNSDFLRLTTRPASAVFLCADSTHIKCSSNVSVTMMTLSKYPNTFGVYSSGKVAQSVTERSLANWLSRKVYK